MGGNERVGEERISLYFFILYEIKNTAVSPTERNRGTEKGIISENYIISEN